MKTANAIELSRWTPEVQKFARDCPRVLLYIIDQWSGFRESIIELMEQNPDPLSDSGKILARRMAMFERGIGVPAQDALALRADAVAIILEEKATV